MRQRRLSSVRLRIGRGLMRMGRGLMRIGRGLMRIGRGLMRIRVTARGAAGTATPAAQPPA